MNGGISPEREYNIRRGFFTGYHLLHTKNKIGGKPLLSNTLYEYIMANPPLVCKGGETKMRGGIWLDNVYGKIPEEDYKKLHDWLSR